MYNITLRHQILSGTCASKWSNSSLLSTSKKMKKKKYHAVSTVRKSYAKVAEGGKILTPNTQVFKYFRLADNYVKFMSWIYRLSFITLEQ